MDRTCVDQRFTTKIVQDNEDGYMAVELYRAQKVEAQAVRVARVIFWDAAGQFYFETFGGSSPQEIPLKIVEELVAEAKTAIKIK